MMGETVTVEKRPDHSIVLTFPEEELFDILSAFCDGESCCRAVAEDKTLGEESADMAVQAAECLKRLSDLFGNPEDSPPPRRLRLVH